MASLLLWPWTSVVGSCKGYYGNTRIAKTNPISLCLLKPSPGGSFKAGVGGSVAVAATQNGLRKIDAQWFMRGHHDLSVKVRNGSSGDIAELHHETSAKSESAVGGGVMEVYTVEELESIIQNSGDKLVVLTISTQICGSCKIIYPKVVKLSKEYPEAIFLRVFGDRNKATRVLMQEWGVKAVPNFRIFKNGTLVHTHAGAKEEQLRAFVSKHYMSMEL